MGIDNNQLVARYFDRKADHAAFFKALEAYLDDQINELYTLDCIIKVTTQKM
ncbi:hypothetical protein [Lacticaseibacillus paracasei]|uniref:hypothetical protein n=1 Tax=Lacticaseibacillus paracasei TaxID=1597 RepID=UPI0002EFFA01|nr:hypothetical protein [Lacticaseibacillus paracasei]RND54433.1 hypothetical protein FAM18121_00705 [Lacticaseibacillus paracasei]